MNNISDDFAFVLVGQWLIGLVFCLQCIHGCPKLRGVYETAYILKFGEPPLVRTIEGMQLEVTGTNDLNPWNIILPPSIPYIAWNNLKEQWHGPDVIQGNDIICTELNLASTPLKIYSLYSIRMSHLLN